MISWWFFKGSCCVLTFCVILFLVFLLFLWLCSFLENQIVFGLGLSCDFLVFYSFFFRLGNSLQKNKLSSFQAGLIRFGYHMCSFLSHAVSLWLMVFSKLRWLVWILYNSIPTGLKKSWELVIACLSCC